jgi:hypothetical protein
MGYIIGARGMEAGAATPSLTDYVEQSLSEMQQLSKDSLPAILDPILTKLG